MSAAMLPDAGFGIERLSRIEDAGLNASAPPQQRWLDGWLVRFSPGKAQRARCVQPVADGRLPLGERLACCEALYRRVGLPMVVRITPFSQPAGLDDALAARGYRRADPTCVMVAPLPLAARQPDDSLTLRPIDSRELARLVGGWRGSSPEACEAHAQRLATSPVAYRSRVAVDASGRALGCGQFALEDDMVGLYDVFTAPDARGRGVATTLCAAMLQSSHQDGATTAYLQVDAANDAARSIYFRLGFRDAYGYHYRVHPADAG